MDSENEWNRPPLREIEAVFNLDTIQKGDVFGYDTLSQLIDATPGTSEWAMRVTEVGQRLQDMLWASGKLFTLRFRKTKLAVLTDTEAALFNKRHFVSGRRRMARAHKQALGVDTTSLDDRARKQHERTLRSQGIELASIAAARKEVRALAHRRERPMLPGAAQGD